MNLQTADSAISLSFDCPSDCVPAQQDEFLHQGKPVETANTTPERKRIPVVTHCGGEIISTYRKKVIINVCTDYGQCTPVTIADSKRADRAKALNEPALWEPVLAKFKDLKVNLGHFGGADAWQQLAVGKPSPRINTISQLMSARSGVYGDFSFNLIKDELDDVFKSQLITNASHRSRALFGTDFWVVLPSGDLKAREEEFLEYMEPHAQSLITDNPKKFLFDLP
jgi:hypothetical protein